MFFGIEVGAKAVSTAEPVTNILHVTQACISGPGKATLKIIQDGNAVWPGY